MSRRRPSRWHGLLPVIKKAGPTSHDVVDMARKALRERRIGHTGTLDPMAEGLLLLCVGQATRLQQYLLAWDKRYLGQVRLGHATTTYDREGEISDPQGPPPPITRAELDQFEARYTGTFEQVPPSYSAKKVAGKKLYELARSGEPVTPEPKQVTVHRIKLRLGEPDLLLVEAATASGFYVRSFAHEMGQHLGCGAFLEHLERARIGPYLTSQAITQKDLEGVTEPEEIIEGPSWIPLAKAQLPFPSITLNPGACERFNHGNEVIVFRSGDEPLVADSQVAVRSQSGELLGVGKVQNVLARGRTINMKPALVLVAK